MAKNKNNIVYIGIAAVIVVIAIIVGIIMAGNRDEYGTDGDSDYTSDTSQTENGTESEVEGEVESELLASDLENVDVTIEYGDYDAMYDLAKSIQNGEATGQVVQIDGDVSHPMSAYSIVEQNEEGTGSIGTQFIIEGDAEYPEDEDRVIITGKVIELEPLVYVIQTLPDFVEVQ